MSDRFEELKTEDNYHKDAHGWEYVDIDDRRQLQKDPSGNVKLYTSPPPPEFSDKFLESFNEAFNDAFKSSPSLSLRIKESDDGQQ